MCWSRERTTRWLPGVVLMLGVAACEDGGPTMRPGEDCLRCHGYEAAGTVFAAVDSPSDMGVNGVLVTITDARGSVATLTTNSAGNFYTDEAIEYPASITLTAGDATATMPAAPKGACNDCHGSGDRIHLP